MMALSEEQKTALARAYLAGGGMPDADTVAALPPPMAPPTPEIGAPQMPLQAPLPPLNVAPPVGVLPVSAPMQGPGTPPQVASPVEFRPTQYVPPPAQSFDPAAYQPVVSGSTTAGGGGGGGSLGERSSGAVYGGEAADMARADRARAASTAAEGVGNLNANAEAQRKAMEAMYRIDQQYEPQRQAALAQQTQQLATNAEASAKVANDQQQYMAKANAAIDGLTADIAKQGRDYNPNRLWEDKSTGSKIGATLLTFVSGISKAFTGDTGADKVLAMIQRDADADIAKQQNTYAMARNALGDKLNMVSMAKSRFADQQQSLHAARIAAMETTKAQLERIGESSNNEKSAANTVMLMSKLQQGIDKERTDLQLRTGELAAKATAQVAGIQESYGRNSSESSSAQLAHVKDERERFVPGIGYALTPVGATKMNDLSAAFRTGQKSFDTLEQLYSRTGYSAAFSPQQKAEVKAAAETIRASIQKAREMHTLSEPEYQRLLKTVPEPDSVDWLRMNAATFRSLRNQSISAFSSEVESHMEPGRHRPMIDARPAGGGEGIGVPRATAAELQAARAETARRRAEASKLRVRGEGG